MPGWHGSRREGFELAGYSGTPLAKKLGIREGSRLALIDAPSDFQRLLEAMPPGLRIVRSARGPLDTIVFFTDSRARLSKRFGALARALQPAGGLWVAWPKRASGVATDLTENVVREIGLATGLVDNKVAAIDEVWSGLRFVVRLRDRPS